MVVQTGAGYGKTTAYSAEEADADPQRFLSYLGGQQ
jgi:hypothetical protein